MSFRLRNQHDPNRTISLTNETWFGILELAEEYGWVPMGTVQPDYWYETEPVFDRYLLEDYYTWMGSPERGEYRLVMIEDALNLADALDRAFLDYEPRRVRWYYEYSTNGLHRTYDSSRPSIGAILELEDFCRKGPFWIEWF